LKDSTYKGTALGCIGLDWRSYGQDESGIVSLLHVMSFGTAKPIFLAGCAGLKDDHVA
jgi:hypothetical protein